MIGAQDEQLKLTLKNLIITECDKDDINADEIPDDVQLFSPESGLDLDSVDALQLSMSLQVHYGVRLTDPKAFRRVVTTINELATYLQPE